MCIFNGPLGFITAIPLILGEAAAITTIIAKTFYLGPALEDLFDEVGMSFSVSVLNRTNAVRHGALDFTPSGPNRARIQWAGGNHCVGQESAWEAHYEASR